VGNREVSAASRSGQAAARDKIGPLFEMKYDRREPSTGLRAVDFHQGTPERAFSMGIENHALDFLVERPGASVWISTIGGANSGTRRARLSSVRSPTTISRIDRASTNHPAAAAKSRTSQVMVFFVTNNSVPAIRPRLPLTIFDPTGGPCARTAVLSMTYSLHAPSSYLCRPGSS